MTHDPFFGIDFADVERRVAERLQQETDELLFGGSKPKATTYNADSIDMQRRPDGVWEARRDDENIRYRHVDSHTVAIDVECTDGNFYIVDEYAPVTPEQWESLVQLGSVEAAQRDPTDSRSVGSFRDEVERVQTITGRFKSRRRADILRDRNYGGVTTDGN